MTAYSAVVRTGGVRGRACVAFNVQRLQPSGTRTSFGGPDDDLFGTLMKDTKAPIPSRSATSKRKPTVIDPVANTTLAWLMSNSCSCCNARWETASRTVSVGHVSIGLEMMCGRMYRCVCRTCTSGGVDVWTQRRRFCEVVFRPRRRHGPYVPSRRVYTLCFVG